MRTGKHKTPWEYLRVKEARERKRLYQAKANKMNINEAFPSKYLKAADMDEDMIVTMTAVRKELIGQGDDQDEKPILFFQETDKGLVLNKTNATTITNLYGPETHKWAGKKIALFTTEVAFGGKQTLAIRVRMKAPKATGGVSEQPELAAGEDPFADGAAEN